MSKIEETAVDPGEGIVDAPEGDQPYFLQPPVEPTAEVPPILVEAGDKSLNVVIDQGEVAAVGEIQDAIFPDLEKDLDDAVADQRPINRTADAAVWTHNLKLPEGYRVGRALYRKGYFLEKNGARTGNFPSTDEAVAHAWSLVGPFASDGSMKAMPAAELREKTRAAIGQFLSAWNNADDKVHRRNVIYGVLRSYNYARLVEVADNDLGRFAVEVGSAMREHQEWADAALKAEATGLMAEAEARLDDGRVPKAGRPSAEIVPLLSTVVLESPYAGNVTKNVSYARKALADCLSRGEAPFASHLLYTQVGVLDDTNPAERERGVTAGYMIADALVCKVVFYVDLGMSPGMVRALDRFTALRRPIEFRYILTREDEADDDL